MKRWQDTTKMVGKVRSTLDPELEELIATAHRSLVQAFAQSDASRLAQMLYERVIASGEPVPADLLQWIEHTAGGTSAAAKLLQAVPFVHKAQKRAEIEQATIGTSNLQKKRHASANYQRYREIAERLIAEHPTLRRATRNHLAQRVRTKLLEQGEAVSARTIMRAFSPEK
jgi:hypothetical protein